MNLLQWITGSIRNKMLMITGSGTTLLLLSALLGLWMSWNGINHSQEDALLRIEEEHLIINIEKNLDKEVKEMKNLLLRGGQESAAIDKHWGSVLKHEQLVKEQIQSLGAKPIFVESVAGIEGEGAGGYATEMSEEYQKAQAELVSNHIAKQDIVITTALIPGRPAPRLISRDMVASMRPGSVIVDMAVEAGGNCPLTELTTSRLLMPRPAMPNTFLPSFSLLARTHRLQKMQRLWSIMISGCEASTSRFSKKCGK